MVDPAHRHGIRTRLDANVRHATWAVRLTTAAGFAMLTGLLAQVEVYAPWNPYVPYTGQLVGVMAAGLVLGPRWAASSMGMYLLLGLFGIPVFADWSAGWVTLKGRTAGYLFGFVAASWLTATMYQRYARAPSHRALARLGTWSVVGGLVVFGTAGVVLGLGDALTTPGLGATTLVSAGFIIGTSLVVLAWSRREGEAFVARLACAFIGSLVVFLPGVVVLQAVSGLPWTDAVAFGVLQFLSLDLVKAFLAAGIAGLVLPPPQ